MDIRNLFKNEEEKDFMMNAIIKEEEKKEKDNLVFIKDKQDAIMEQVYNCFKEGTSLIDDDEVFYFPEEYDFTQKEFCMLFQNLMNFALEKNKKSRESYNIFENYNFFLIYKDMKILMRIMWGQGTCMQMRTDLLKQWRKSKTFTYDDYKKSIISTL